MPQSSPLLVAGVDVGSECVKAVVIGEERSILGRSVVPSTGYFNQRAREALENALDEAQQTQAALRRVCVTGFAARSAGMADAVVAGDATCQARAVFHHFPEAQTALDIGARDPKMIRVDGKGNRLDSRALRKCGVGVGSFLMSAARHLDVHPTRLMELASAADHPVSISSYCSVYGESEVLEALRDGATREQIAMGCMHAVAERILEIGPLEPPITVCGGVPEYFPGVIAAIGAKAHLAVRVVPEPIQTAALGAALVALAEAERG